jgi:hypothetical protein
MHNTPCSLTPHMIRTPNACGTRGCPRRTSSWLASTSWEVELQSLPIPQTYSGVPETAEHIFSHCPRASDVWRILCITLQTEEYKRPWILGRELSLPPQGHLDVILLVLWHIWKARNGLIYDRKTSSAEDVIRRVIDNVDAWKCRYKKHSAQLQCSRHSGIEHFT